MADRLSNPDLLQLPGRRPLEVRLLAVEPEKRNSTVLFGLVHALYMDAESNGYTHLYISGVEQRVLVFDNGTLVGILSPADIGRVLTIRQSAGGAPRP